MKKRLIIVNSIIIFCSLLVMLITSLFVINQVNINDANEKIENYLEFATEIFDGDNLDESKEVLHNIDNDVRITIIDLDGKVIIDSDKDDVTDNHLSRPEIKNIGSAYSRYSNTMGRDMLYIATIDDGYYLRIAIPMDDINEIITFYVAISIISLLIIFSISFALTSFFIRNSINNINKNVKNLAELAEDNTITDLSIDDLPIVLNALNNELKSKIDIINLQNEKTNTIINEMNEGLIALDKNGKIIQINNKALEIFDVGLNDVINKNYIYLIRNVELQELIGACYKDKELKKYTCLRDNRSYSVFIKNIEEKWLDGGIIISLIDVTQRVLLEQTKKDFFANASHELKSPLTCIIGYQQMVTEDIVTDSESIKEYSKKTLKEANRMNNIIIDMLNLSNFEAGNENKDIEEISIDSLLNDVLDSFQSILKLKNITVYKNINNVKLKMHKKQVLELVTNLIDNAIKYNKENGVIHIELTNEYFSVSDSGIGIPEDEQNRIFERFYRVDKGKSKTMGGTGLGLAIVKHVCENHGYDIQLQSKINEGTKITIIF